MKHINTEQLVKIANKNKTAEALFTSWAVRERNREEIDVNRTKNVLLEEKFKIVPEELISALKDLERIGAGEFRLGRNGQPTRFRLNYSLKELGKAALGEKPVKQTAAVPAPTPVKKDLHLSIVLGDNRRVSINAPSDLSDKELVTIVDSLMDLRR